MFNKRKRKYMQKRIDIKKISVKAINLYNKKLYDKSIKEWSKIPNSVVKQLDDDLSSTIWFNKSLPHLGKNEIEHYKIALKLLRDCIERAHDDLGKQELVAASLSYGDFKYGFDKYRTRYEYNNYYKAKAVSLREYSSIQPNLVAEDEFNDLQDKTVLILDEQGLGDKIMFSLAFKWFSSKVKFCTSTTPKSICNLFKKCYGHIENFEFINDEEQLPRKYDAITTLGDIFVEYYKVHGQEPRTQDADINKDWIQPIKSSGIGVSCISAFYTDNHKEKSLNPSVFSKNYNGEKITWIQMGDTPKGFIKGIPDDADFTYTANVISGLDMCYCVDTSVAHLCGLLGVKCKVIISQYYDWRWRHFNLYESTEILFEKDLIEDLKKSSIK